MSILGSIARGFAALSAGDAQQEGAKEGVRAQQEYFGKIEGYQEPFQTAGGDALNILSQMFFGTPMRGVRANQIENPEYQALQQQIEGVHPLFRSAGMESRNPEYWDLQNRLSQTDQYIDDPAKFGSAAPQNGLAPNFTDFFKSPGYQFRQDEGIRALDRSASARGRLNSGAHERELIRYGSGFASSEFNNYASRLSALASGGQQAANQLTTAAFGTGRGVANSLFQAGTAEASGIAGAGQAFGSGLDDASRLAGYFAGGFNGLSGGSAGGGNLSSYGG